MFSRGVSRGYSQRHLRFRPSGEVVGTAAAGGETNAGAMDHPGNLPRLSRRGLVLNALRIRENLGKDPVAERLLRNMLRYAAQELKRPLADLPADFDAQLNEMGYH